MGDCHVYLPTAGYRERSFPHGERIQCDRLASSGLEIHWALPAGTRVPLLPFLDANTAASTIVLRLKRSGPRLPGRRRWPLSWNDCLPRQWRLECGGGRGFGGTAGLRAVGRSAQTTLVVIAQLATRKFVILKPCLAHRVGFSVAPQGSEITPPTAVKARRGRRQVSAGSIEARRGPRVGGMSGVA